jgi:hypothetical protein
VNGFNEDEDPKQKALAELLIGKYRGASDDSKLKAAQSDQKRAGTVSLFGEALSGLATAHAKARGYEPDNTFWGKLKGYYDGDVANAQKDIEDKKSSFLMEDKLGQTAKERFRSDAEYNRNKAMQDSEDSPESFETITYRSLAQKYMPKGDFSKMSASQIKRAIPSLQGMYEIEARKSASEAEAKRREFEYNRNKQDELAKETRAETRKIEGEKRAATGGKKMSTEERARLDNIVMGSKAVEDMALALSQGDNTFSLVGDNDFTESRTRFEEALGRMQSGGAITKDEEERFKRMAPTWTDSADMQQRKLLNLRTIMSDRAKTLGRSEFTDGIGGSGPQIFGSGSIPDAD